MFVSIIGTAQSGKTTLFKALAGANGNGNNGGGTGSTLSASRCPTRGSMR